MKYKPFDLEAAKAGKPLISRDGVPCKFIAYVPEVHDRQIVYLRNDFLCTNNESGRHHPTPATESGLDLFMAPEKKTVWVNIYDSKNDSVSHVASVEFSRAAADRTPFPNRIACIEVTYTEGEGL